MTGAQHRKRERTETEKVTASWLHKSMLWVVVLVVASAAGAGACGTAKLAHLFPCPGPGQLRRRVHSIHWGCCNFFLYNSIRLLMRPNEKTHTHSYCVMIISNHYQENAIPPYEVLESLAAVRC